MMIHILFCFPQHHNVQTDPKYSPKTFQADQVFVVKTRQRQNQVITWPNELHIEKKQTTDAKKHKFQGLILLEKHWFVTSNGSHKGITKYCYQMILSNNTFGQITIKVQHAIQLCDNNFIQTIQQIIYTKVCTFLSKAKYFRCVTEVCIYGRLAMLISS